MYRPLRRSDLASYTETVLLGIGKLETSTGLAESAEATIRSLSRWPVRFLLGFFRAIGRPMVDILVAADGTEVAGTGTILWLPKAAYVAGMATKPEFRGQGIASRILALQNAEAKRRRRPWLALDVESDNDTAIRVYRKAGYREVAKFTWYTRAGLPPAEGPVPPGTRPVVRSEWHDLVARLDASRPEEYRAVFPSGSRVLNHNEHLVRGMRSEHRTWAAHAEDGPSGVLRAYFLPRTRIGAYFPMTVGPESAKELPRLFDAATEWLRPRGPSRCLAVAAEPPGAIRSLLERFGFSGVVSSTTMVRATTG